MEWKAQRDATTFNLYRAAGGSDRFEKLNTEPLTSRIFRDDNATAGVAYRYTVRAVGRRGIESAPAPVATAAALPESREPVLVAAFGGRTDVGSGSVLAKPALRDGAKLALAVAAALLATTDTESLAAGTGKSPQPDIPFILADDLGRTDVGFMGCKEIRTPHLDKLANAGAVLDAFHVQPVCSPTRAALMTVRYAAHTGVYTIVRPHAKWGLPLADALHVAGHETAICGKWHLGEFEEAYRPTKRGFDHQYGHWFGAIDYFKHDCGGLPSRVAIRMGDWKLLLNASGGGKVKELRARLDQWMKNAVPAGNATADGSTVTPKRGKKK